jgi:small GTP-binding protein
MVLRKGRVFKIVLVGEGGVGKTSLIKQFVYQQFEDKYIKTLGTNVYKKSIGLTDSGQKDIHLQIWDVLGQKVFASIIKVAYHNAQGVIFVCDLTKKETLEGLETWVSYAYEHAPNASFIFLANKNDLPNKTFGSDELGAYSYRFNSPFFFTSARSGENVEQAFNAITKAIVDGKKAPTVEEVKLRKQHFEIKPNIGAEDEIITQFCKAAGGFDVAMPVVREQFKKLNVNFENPSPQDLKKVVGNLVVYTEYIKGKEAAIEMEKNLGEILKKRGM